MTNSPCFDTKTKTDCPKRCVGCKIDCPEWAQWLKVHESETQKIRDAKALDQLADGFLIEQKDRMRKDTMRRSEIRNRRCKA